MRGYIDSQSNFNSFYSYERRHQLKFKRKDQIWGLIADETSDISQIEQLSIFLRKVNSILSVKEFVFGFYTVGKCDVMHFFV